MRDRAYGQFCGLARAAEILGQRWTLLILRDLLVAPRRYSDLVEGLPGIPSGGLARRLAELEADGLVVRTATPAPNRSVLYAATERTQELLPALDALGRWGAAGMRRPRTGEVVTDASLVSALRSAVQPVKAPASRQTTIYEVRVGQATAHAVVDGGDVELGPGQHPAADLQIQAGPEFRDVLAGTLDAHTAVEQGVVQLVGDEALLDDFVALFRVPYSAHVPAMPE